MGGVCDVVPGREAGGEGVGGVDAGARLAGGGALGRGSELDDGLVEVVVGLGDLLLEEGVPGGQIDQLLDQLRHVLHRLRTHEHHLAHIPVHALQYKNNH